MLQRNKTIILLSLGTTKRKYLKSNTKFLFHNNDKMRDKDPTRTVQLRKRFSADATRRLKSLKRDIKKSIVDNDIFGLKNQAQLPTALAELPANKFRYTYDANKVNGFMAWLEQQHKQGLIETSTIGARGAEPWSNTYIRSAYQKGLYQARQELISGRADIPAADTLGSGVSAAFHRPFHADRAALLYTRIFNALKGVTQAMDAQISHELTKGMTEGVSPYEMARRITDRVDKIGIVRARLITRTEVVNAHNQASLREYEWAEQEIGETIKVQWWTALDERVRSSHRARHGKIYDRATASGMLGEPNCRCTLLSVVGSEGEKEAKRSLKDIPALDSWKREVPSEDGRTAFDTGIKAALPKDWQDKNV